MKRRHGGGGGGDVLPSPNILINVSNLFCLSKCPHIYISLERRGVEPSRCPALRPGLPLRNVWRETHSQGPKRRQSSTNNSGMSDRDEIRLQLISYVEGQGRISRKGGRSWEDNQSERRGQKVTELKTQVIWHRLV